MWVLWGQRTLGGKILPRGSCRLLSGIDEKGCWAQHREIPGGRRGWSWTQPILPAGIFIFISIQRELLPPFLWTYSSFLIVHGSLLKLVRCFFVNTGLKLAGTNSSIIVPVDLLTLLLQWQQIQWAPHSVAGWSESFQNDSVLKRCDELAGQIVL